MQLLKERICHHNDCVVDQCAVTALRAGPRHQSRGVQSYKDSLPLATCQYLMVSTQGSWSSAISGHERGFAQIMLLTHFLISLVWI